MKRQINNYAKSSANCYDESMRTSRSNLPGLTKTSNRAIHTVSSKVYPKYYTKSTNFDFKTMITPGFEGETRDVINKKIFMGKIMPGYETKNGCYYRTICDGSQIDAKRGMLITLDKPPLNTAVPADRIYSKELDKYGTGYTSYKDIDGGTIEYYTDKGNSGPFTSPNFVTAGYELGRVYTDPMGSIKPEYFRSPLKTNDPITSEKNTYEYKLSWMDDTMAHRQDMMARQLQKINQTSWTARWVDNKNP